MREKANINLKNKINIKNLLVKKVQQSFNLQSINIQTITKDKTQYFFNEKKKFNNIKFPNKIRYLNSTLSNYSISNNYLSNEEQTSFFSFYNSNKEPSPINSLNSSPYSTYTQKKRNYKRLQQKYKYRYHNFNINSSNSINNLSLNSKIINTNQSVSLSSSSSSYNDCSDSSDFSYRSRKNKRKNFKDLMMAEDDELDYLKRREVGLVSDDEEENNNSIDNNSLEENLSNEIERILIEIYNKNISLISSGNYNDINKNKNEIEDIEKQIKKFLKKKNFKTNLLVLKCLSNKIKELVGKYKEKVFEIEEIKTLYDTCKLKMQLLRNNQIIGNNNSVGSNDATNLNSSYDSSEENFFKNNFLLNVQNELTGKGVSNILLRELINIKKTLKISSKEIEGIFKYPLNLLKNEKGKKIKFSVELMQSEEFCKTLLNDEFIYNLLSQMKGIFSQISIPNLTQWIEEVVEDCDHKNEMTRFVKYINEKLGITNENNDINKNESNNYLGEYKMKESIKNNTLEEQIDKNIAFSLDTGSSTEGVVYKNDNIVKSQNSKDFEEYKINNDTSNKKTKNKKQKKNESENNNENNKLNFKDIDELLNYINDETDSKKGKKKNKKGRKNKKQNNSNKETEDNNTVKNRENNNEEDSQKANNDEDFEKIFNDFKNDIEKDSVYIYDINKIEPCLSDDFISNKCAN